MATGRTAITKTDLAGAFQLLSEELHKAVSEGYVVKLPFGSFYLSASGTFDQLDIRVLPFASTRETPGTNSDSRGRMSLATMFPTCCGIYPGRDLPVLDPVN